MDILAGIIAFSYIIISLISHESPIIPLLIPLHPMPQTIPNINYNFYGWDFYHPQMLVVDGSQGESHIIPTLHSSSIVSYLSYNSIIDH